MEVEVYFLRYAFPCANVLLDSGKINQDTFDRLKDAAIKGVVLARRELEEIFNAAFRRIGQVSKEMKKDIWALDVLKSYWREKHNLSIDSGDGLYSELPKSFCDLCRVYEGEVVGERKFEGKRMLQVRFGKEEMFVFDCLVPNVKVGDKVRIHYAYAVEII